VKGVSVKPVLWKLARVDFDPVRNRKVLLYPEGAMLLNDTGAEILSLCDGQRTVEDIAATLGAKYGTDVTADVRTYLTALADRELVRYAD
jgi:pyrroloquinoline quinone biosynthesis protein D